MRFKPVMFIIIIIVMSSILYSFTQNNTTKLKTQDISHQISSSDTNMSSDELKKYNGLNGEKCYVAVNGKVYNIPLDKIALWLGGKHIPSGGMAMCGKDLSTIIGSSPHGLSKLDVLDIVSNHKP